MNQSLTMTNTYVRHKLLLIILLLLGSRAFAGNSFMPVVNKLYSEYIMDLKNIYYIPDSSSTTAGQMAKDDKLHAAYERAESYKRLSICITVGLLVTSGILLYAIILYHRKCMAYRVLVKKSQEWAAAKKIPLNESFKPIEPAMNYEPVEPESILLTETETALMQRIRRLMDDEKVYIDPNFTLADIAARLEVNRTYISATINRCEGKTLTNLMNEYRIMLAIDVMSSPENATLTIDAIAEFSGFNDRKTFYRIFKKTTGLAPSEFRASVTVGE